MFILKGRYMETTSYINKEGKTVTQAVIYSDGDGKTYPLTGYNAVNKKPLEPVEIPVTVTVYEGKLFLRVIN